MCAPANHEDFANMRIEPNKCVICGEISSFSDEVHSQKDRQSWTVLYNAAVVRNVEPISKLRGLSDELLCTVKYHRKCRADFTLIKALRKLQSEGSSSSVNSHSETPCSSKPPEKRLKRLATDLRQTTYTQQCIFCDKTGK